MEMGNGYQQDAVPCLWWTPHQRMVVSMSLCLEEQSLQLVPSEHASIISLADPNVVGMVCTRGFTLGRQVTFCMA